MLMIEKQIIFLAQSCNKKVRVMGCGHSPSDICCTTDYMINLCLFNNVLHVNRELHTVRVESGITFTKLNAHLDKHKLAFPVYVFIHFIIDFHFELKFTSTQLLSTFGVFKNNSN